jgi:hypothetical protein
MTELLVGERASRLELRLRLRSRDAVVDLVLTRPLRLAALDVGKLSNKALGMLKQFLKAERWVGLLSLGFQRGKGPT